MRWLLLSLFLLPSLAWAEVTVIYRTSDQAVVGYVYPGQPLATEMQNVLQSEVGGVVEDYATVTLPDLPFGASVTVTPAGKAVITTKEARQTQAEAVRQAKAAALRVKLNLSAQEFEELREALR